MKRYCSNFAKLVGCIIYLGASKAGVGHGICEIAVMRYLERIRPVLYNYALWFYRTKYDAIPDASPTTRANRFYQGERLCGC